MADIYLAPRGTVYVIKYNRKLFILIRKRKIHLINLSLFCMYFLPNTSWGNTKFDHNAFKRKWVADQMGVDQVVNWYIAAATIQ